MFKKTVFAILVTQILQYIKSAALLPVVITYAAWIFVNLIPLQEVYFGGSLLPLFQFLPFLSSRNIEIGNSEILQAYSVLTLGIYILELFFMYILRIQLNISTKLKIPLIGIPAISFILFVLLYELRGVTTARNVYFAFFILLMFTYICMVWYFVVSYASKFIITHFQKSMK